MRNFVKHVVSKSVEQDLESVAVCSSADNDSFPGTKVELECRNVSFVDIEDLCLCFSFLSLLAYFRRLVESSIQVAPHSRLTAPVLLEATPEEASQSCCSNGVDDESADSGDFPEWRSVSMVSAPIENRLVTSAVMGDTMSAALLDSGATFSMVHSQWLDLCGIPYHKGPESLMNGFGLGNGIRVIGTVSSVISIDKFFSSSVDLKVVASPPAVEIPIILAADFLAQHGIQVDLGRSMVSRGLCDGGRVELYLPASSDECAEVVFRDVPCYSLKSVSVKSAEASKVPVRVSSSVMADVRPSSIDPEWLFRGNEESPRVCYMSGMIPEISNFEVLAIGVGGDGVVREGDLVGTICTLVMSSLPDPGGEEVSCVMQADESGSEPEVPSVAHRIRELTSESDHVSDSQQDQVRTMLLGHEAVFSVNPDDVGMMGTVAHRIELLDDTPIYQKPRRLPEPISEEIDRQCSELQLADIIEPSISPWSSPVVPVRKKDGSIRLCVDYRRLNAVTKPVRFPLPNLTDAVFGLHGVKYFTSLDLVRGYYQLPLHEDSREYTAFSTPRGHFQFKRLSFGLTNAPAAFQSQMQSVLASFPRSSVIVYIDDVLIMSRSFEDHLALVRKVLTTLLLHGIKVKFEKCSWFVKEVEYLGHRVSGDGIRKSAQFVQKVNDLPRPSTVRQLREFLGLVNFQRKFVPHFSSVQKPLTEKAVGKSSRRIVWTDAMEGAFEELKRKVCEDVMLAYPNYNPDQEPLELFVDASGTGGGACLCQKQDGLMKVIAYASMSFNKAQLHYSTIERELCALRWGVKTFRPFLIGMEFIVHTDHQPLIYLSNMKLVDTRLARTLEDLSDYNFEIRYTPGKDNAAADCLSRLYAQPCVTVEAENCLVPGRLSPDLYVAKEVSGGGDSLFESLHILSERSSLGRPSVPSPLELRLLLVDDLMKNPSEYGLSLNRGSRKALKLMIHAGQLPCVEVLFSFGRLFKCVVFVHFGGDAPVLYVPPGDHSDVLRLARVHLQCLSGIHFNPVSEYPTYEYSGPLKCVRTGAHCDAAADVVEPPQSEDVQAAEESEEGHDVTNESVNLVDLGPMWSEVDGSSWCNFHSRSHFTQAMVSVMGRRRCALIDTGAQLSCVAREVCIAIDAEINTTTEVMLAGFGGSRKKALGSLKLSVGLDGAPRSPAAMDFVVVDEGVMPFCLILGADYLSLNAIAIDFGSGFYVQNKKRFLCFGFPKLAEKASSHLVSAQFYCSLPLTVKHVCLGSREQPLTVAVDRTGTVPRMSSPIAYDEVRAHQKSSRLLRALRGALGRPDHQWPQSLKQFRRYARQLSVQDGLIVYRLSDDMSSVVVSHHFLIEFVLVMHHRMGHLGRNKLISAVREVVWHPKLAEVSGDVSRACEVCQKYKTAALVAPPVHKIVTSQPFELVAADLISLPSCSGFIGCLVVCDHYSKWMAAVPLRSKTSVAVAAALEHRVLQTLPRCPVTLLTDNGPEFRGEKFKCLLDAYGVSHQYTTPNKPSSNGLVERANRTLQELLRVQSGGLDRWSEALPRAVMTYNMTAHSALNCSPAEFLLTFKHSLNSSLLLSRNTRDRWREGHPSFGSFKLHQLVLRRVVPKGNCTENKFLERFEGPYRVTEVNRNQVTYQLEHSVTGAQARAHHVQLRPFHLPPRYLLTHPSYERIVRADSPESEALDVEEWEEDDDDSSVGEVSSESSSSVGAGSAARGSSVREFWVPSDDSSGDSDFSSDDSHCELPIDHCRDAGSVISLNQAPETSDDGVLRGTLPLWDEESIDHLLPRIDFPLEVSDTAVEEIKSAVDCDLASGVVLNEEMEFWEVSTISFPEHGSIISDESEESLPCALCILNGTVDSMGPYWQSSGCSSCSVSARVEGGDHHVVGSGEVDELDSDALPRLFWESPSHGSVDAEGDIAEQHVSSPGRRSSLIGSADVGPDVPRAWSSPIATRSRGPVRDLPYVMSRVLEYRRSAKSSIDPIREGETTD